MKLERIRFKLTAAVVAAFALTAAGASAQLSPNQTAGFAKNRNFTFTYTQNFDCLDQPQDDLNFNGILAESDPLEMQTPICRVGQAPSIDPTGAKINTTDKLYVLVPLFSVTPDTNASDALPCPSTEPSFAPNLINGVTMPVTEVCGPALGNFLISTFGSIPDAFRIQSALDKGITTQCPSPTDPEGSCTMHADATDLAAALSLPGNVMVPLLNHSHIINTSLNTKPIWWQVIVDEVHDPAVWPAADGSSGLTSLKALRQAQNTPTTVSGGSGNQAAADVPTNFFLFFGTHPTRPDSSSSMAGMPGM
jgi:hypothetical protein